MTDKQQPPNIAMDKFRKSVGFQINFILYSGLDVQTAIEHICSAAETLVNNARVHPVDEGRVEKAHYESAHEARYMMTHAVHPDILVLWFLALKSHWFDDPVNMFFGMREQAKAYLYKWVETGELADDNTTLEIATKAKFEEWLESSWTTSPVLPQLSSSEPCSECGAENSYHRTTCLRHPRFTVPARSTDG